MASKTTNYGLHKFDLTDSPPDITAINDSMDKIDTELKKRVENTKVLPVENGGTGKATRNEAFYNLAFLGNNPISSTDEDTTQKWGKLGSGYARFNTLNMIDQPYVFMFVLNYVHEADIFQIGSGQGGTSTVYYRTGNGRSWYMNWTPLFGANSTVPIANGGTGATSTDNAFKNLSTNYGYASAVSKGAVDMNTLTTSGLYATSFDGDTDLTNYNTPITGVPNMPVWFNVFVFGVDNRLTQLAVFGFSGMPWTGKLWIRYKHDNNWFEWAEIITSRSLLSEIQSLLQSGGVSVVKSVQRGTLKLIDASSATTSVTISSINMNKSFLLIDGQNYTAGNAGSFNASGKIKNNTTLEFTPTFGRNERYDYEINWQVVEYY